MLSSCHLLLHFRHWASSPTTNSRSGFTLALFKICLETLNKTIYSEVRADQGQNKEWKQSFVSITVTRVPTRPGKMQFFRLSWNSGVLIKISWKSHGIPMFHGIWFSMAVFQWPVCYFSSCFMHYTGPWKTGILKGAMWINTIIRCYVLRDNWWNRCPIRNHQFSTYFYLRGPTFNYQGGRGLEVFFK